MELTGKLKEKVSKCKNLEQAKEEIEKAGMILNNSELDGLAGGLVISDSAMKHIIMERKHIKVP